MAAVEAETAKKQAALGTQIVLQAQVRTAVELQRSAGIYNSHQEIAIQKAAEGVRIAQDQLIAQQKIAEQTERGAQARLQMSMQAAETLRSQQLQEAQQQATNNSISQGANEMGRLANEAERAAGAAAGVGAASGGGGKMGSSSFKSRKSTYENPILNEWLPLRFQLSGAKRESISSDSNRDKRLINHPEHGQMSYNEFVRMTQGESLDEIRGIGEYKKPSASVSYSLSGAMSRYSGSPQGGGGAVNVTYSGTTLNFNGDEYVQKKDVGGIIKSATNATQSRMANSATYRLNAGMS